MRYAEIVPEAKVWHGSPHPNIAQLSTAHIGSGEGAQTFGWGLYFADRKTVAKTYGKLYKIVLPDQGYLLWDAPIESQSNTVKHAIQPYLNEYYSQIDPKTWVTRFGLPETGGQAYETMARMLGSQKTASLELMQAGVIGIKYLDGKSRKRGSGSFNYVIFDDKVITKQRAGAGVAPYRSDNLKSTA